MLAGRKGRDRVLGMQRRRTQDLDGVDVVVCEQFVNLFVHTRHVPFMLSAFEHFGPWITQSHKLALFVLEIAGHVQRRDVPNPNDSHSYAIHMAEPATRVTSRSTLRKTDHGLHSDHDRPPRSEIRSPCACAPPTVGPCNSRRPTARGTAVSPNAARSISS